MEIVWEKVCWLPIYRDLTEGQGFLGVNAALEWNGLRLLMIGRLERQGRMTQGKSADKGFWLCLLCAGVQVSIWN